MKIDLEDRRKSLGGSDIAPILDVSPFKTKYEVYEEKVNGIQNDLSQNNSVVWGNLLESVVAKRYEQVTGDKIYFPEEKYTHKDYPFLTGHPDALLLDEKVGLEIKTASERNKHLWGDSGTTEIPEYYYPQIIHYMSVLDYDRWDLAVLIGGNDFRIYSFERDRGAEDAINEQSVKFWEEHIVKRVAPPVSSYDSNMCNFFKKKYAGVNGEIVQLDDSFIELFDDYEALGRVIKHSQDDLDEIKAKILEALGEASAGVLSDGRQFIRQEVNRKGYVVKPSKFVTLNFKGVKNE